MLREKGSIPLLLEQFVSVPSNESAREKGPELSSLTLKDLTAEFICSGPFHLVRTTYLDRHLFVDNDNGIHIYYDFGDQPCKSFGILIDHFFWDHKGINREYTQHI